MSQARTGHRAPSLNLDFSGDEGSDLFLELAFILLAVGDFGEDGAPLGHGYQLFVEKLIMGLVQADLTLGISGENGFDLLLLLGRGGIQTI